MPQVLTMSSVLAPIDKPVCGSVTPGSTGLQVPLGAGQAREPRRSNALLPR